MFLFCPIMFLLLLSLGLFQSFPTKELFPFAHKCSYLMILILNIIKEASCFLFLFQPHSKQRIWFPVDDRNIFGRVMTNIVSYSRVEIYVHFYTLWTMVMEFSRKMPRPLRPYKKRKAGQPAIINFFNKAKK